MRLPRKMSLAVMSGCFLTLCMCRQADDETDPVVSVETSRVVRADVADWLQLYGDAVAPPVGGGSAGGSVQIAAPAAAIVRALPVREGQSVTAHTLIARLDDRVANAQLAEANATLTVASERLSRQSKLLAVGGVAANTVEDAKQQVTLARAAVAVARDSVSRGWLASPIAGTVTHIYVRSGQAVDAGAPVADIVNGGAVTVAISVPVIEISRIRLGQTVEVTGPGIAGRLAGRVDYISPAADPNTAAVTVRAHVFSRGELRQGQPVSVRISTAVHAGSLVAPITAVYTEPDGTSSVAVVRRGVARRVTITRGLEDGDLVEISGPGIGVGTVLATTGSYGLEDGTHVRISPTAQPMARP